MTAIGDLHERAVQLHGSGLARRVLGAFGWHVRFNGLPSRQGVVIVYPHTSNWDFVIGLLAKWSIGFPLSFWGKDSLFSVPLFGRWLRWVGGVPVDRKHPRGVVGQMIERMQAAKANDEFCWLALAPEGTRSYRAHWRTGFYQVALNADVPLGLAYFDFVDRVVGVDTFVRLSGDAQADMAAIGSRLGHRRGCNPHLAAPVKLPGMDSEGDARA
ncbi:MAG: 1-acyl-sn-glycerol-3-phosphate acyltransferase [Aquincola sp.]|nr:1-acyl-sn-glycerol-3-phosphate acyltransferase [Aquincola sp.]MDH5332122.1 1-acyl-sn-glycerol-3-phosphate acyltransferase [Aquincola sp.]